MGVDRSWWRITVRPLASSIRLYRSFGGRDAAVADGHDDFAGLRVLERIADEIAERDRDDRRRRRGRERLLDLDAHVDRLVAEMRPLHVDDLLDDARDVGRLAVGRRLALAARQEQQRVGQLGRLAHGALDATQALAKLVGEIRRSLQQFSRARDDRERRAQFVAHVGVEFAVAFD